MERLSLLFLVLAATFCHIDGAFGQVLSDSEKLDLILKELRELRVVLDSSSGLPAERPTTASLQLRPDERAIGSNNAPITIVAFTDYQCPFCRQFAETTYPYLKRLYIDTGKVRFVVRDLPLPAHPDAEKAAQAARCAHDQGIFAGYHDYMQSHAWDLSSSALLSYAAELEADVERFRACLERDEYLGIIREEARESIAIGVDATPSFLVGRTTAEGVQGVWVVGAMPLGVFERAFERRD